MIRKENELACSLDILFLRRDKPGALVGTGGDLDNRLKVLLDGLRVPSEGKEIGKNVPSEGEDPFYCLLQDDALIMDLSISTDRLLTPKEDGEHVNDVILIIRVATKVLPGSRVVRAWEF